MGSRSRRDDPGPAGIVPAMRSLPHLARAAALVLSLPALTVLAACGGSDDDATEAIAASLAGDASLASVGLELSHDDAHCVAEGLVDDVGTDRLEEYGLLVEDGEAPGATAMSAGDARTTAAVLAACADLTGILPTILDAGVELTDEQSACLGDAVGEDDLEALLASVFTGAPPDLDALLGDATGCLV